MSVDPIAFTVYGVPAAKGAVRPVPIRKKTATGWQTIGSRLTEDSRYSRPWAALVKDAARQAVPGRGLPFPRGTPVMLLVVFFLRRPVSAPKRVIAPTTKPDVDKLTRAIGDALTGIVYHDDAQIVSAVVCKAYACDGRPRAEIAVAIAPVATQWPWNGDKERI